MTGLRPFQLGVDEGRGVWYEDSLMRFKAVGADTGDQYWLTEQVANRGFAPPLHRHTREEELFLVLEGELHVDVGEQIFEVSAGGTAFAPRGLPHTFRVESPTARFLVLGTPAGFEHWFFEVSTPVSGVTPPPLPDGPPDVAALISSLARYGVEVLPPPS